QRNKLLERKLLGASRAELLDIVGCYAVNPQSDKLICVRTRIAKPLEFLYEFRRNAMNTERNQLVWIEMRITEPVECLHEFGRDSVDAERDQLVCIQSFYALCLHLARKPEADIVYRKRELLVRGESAQTQRIHLRPILRIRFKREQARAFSILQKTVTLDVACVPGDRETNVVLAGSGSIQPVKIAGAPIGT